MATPSVVPVKTLVPYTALLVTVPTTNPAPLLFVDIPDVVPPTTNPAPLSFSDIPDVVPMITPNGEGLSITVNVTAKEAETLFSPAELPFAGGDNMDTSPDANLAQSSQAGNAA
jgi:hypothetical protein